MKNTLYILLLGLFFTACDSTKRATSTASDKMDKAEKKVAEAEENVKHTFGYDRSKAPEPGPARSIDLGKYNTFKMDNGLTVIVVENHKIPKVSWQLSVDRDPIKEGKKAGYVSMAGQMLDQGTTNRSKAEIDEAIDFMGASLSTGSTGMFASSLSKYKEDLLEIMTDVLYNPSFPEEEFEKIRKQTLSNIAQGKENPNVISNQVTDALRYGKDHPYGEISTEETVGNITLEDTKNYYNTYFKPNISYLVVVGDITVDEAKTLSEKYFGDWEKAEVPSYEYDFPERPSGTKVAFVPKDGAVQSVIKVTNVVDLEPASEDRIPASVMNAIMGGGVFSGRLMQNLREDKGYTYGARSQLSPDELVGYFGAGASVRNEVTDSAVVEFMYELEKMRNEPVTQEELSLVKNVLSGSFARSLESPQTVARFALNTVKYDLDADYYKNYLKKLNAVTIADVQRMAQKYIRPDQAYISVVGNKDEVSDKLARFDASGKVSFYDPFGNPIKMTETPMADGMTAEAVLEDYFSALGGKSKLESLKSITTKTSGAAFGMTLSGVTTSVVPDKAYNKMGAPGMTFIEQKYDGTRGSMSGMQTGGEAVEMDEAGLQQMQEMAKVFPELYYMDNESVEMEFKGVGTVDGKPAYKIQYRINGAESTMTDYFDQESSLKVKRSMNSPQGSVTISYEDYKEVDGILFPHKTVINNAQMPAPIEMKVEEIMVNPEVDMSIFTIE